jgi:uncharacterized repeat protein (TIGR01451 family)
MKPIKLIVAGAIIAVASLVGAISLSATANAEGRECGDNAIIRCGAMSASELKSEYAKNERGLKKIYSYYNIDASDIASSTSAKTGTVHTNGEVIVDGKVVATNAYTVGRSGSLGGSKVDANGWSVYQGADRLKSTLSAYVFFNADGSFKSAVIKVCGNPVKATPKPVSKPGISLTKTVNGGEHATVPVGQTFMYEIVVTNTGNVALTNAVVTDTAPNEVTPLSASAGTLAGQKWTYTIPSLAVKESKTFTITAKYAVYASGTHINTACVDTPTIPATNPDACDSATTSTGEKITVCDTNTKQIITIDRSEFDESHMTTDQSKCQTIVTPPELPHTGITDMLGGGLGLSGLVGASWYYVGSRRSLR